MKPERDYDLLVIGGGSAGHAAAKTGAAAGMRTALVESADTLGGLCILSGCMPSKTLLETAHRMRAIRDAGRFGILVKNPTLDEEALRNRLYELIAGFRQDRVAEIHHGGYELIRGRARFTSPHEVTIDERDGSNRNVAASTFVIATGSSPRIPEVPGLNGAAYWTSDHVAHLPHVPKHLAILGAGPVGLEYAHLFHGLGTAEITILVRGNRILSGADPDVSTAIEGSTAALGIRFAKHTTITAVGHRRGTFELELSDGTTLKTDALLIAAGRTPNTRGLGLSAAGVACDDGRIVIDERCATSASHIFAAGDCATPIPVVHLAVQQGEIAAHNARRLIYDRRSTVAREWDHCTAMVAWFTEPQAAQVGLTEEALRATGMDVVSAKFGLENHGKCLIAGAATGFVKLIAERETGRIVSAAAVGPAVAETIHSIAVAIHARLTVAEFLVLPHYHPTFSEAWSRAASKLEKRLRPDPAA